MGIVIFHHITWYKINYCDIILYAFISIRIITIPFGFAKTSKFGISENSRKNGNSDYLKTISSMNINQILTAYSFEQARKALKKPKATFSIIVHPSMITYDERIVKTRKEFQKREKKNKQVKEFREYVWYED